MITPFKALNFSFLQVVLGGFGNSLKNRDLARFAPSNEGFQHILDFIEFLGCLGIFKNINQYIIQIYFVGLIKVLKLR